MSSWARSPCRPWILDCSLLLGIIFSSPHGVSVASLSIRKNANVPQSEHNTIPLLVFGIFYRSFPSQIEPNLLTAFKIQLFPQEPVSQWIQKETRISPSSGLIEEFSQAIFFFHPQIWLIFLKVDLNLKAFCLQKQIATHLLNHYFKPDHFHFILRPYSL